MLLLILNLIFNYKNQNAMKGSEILALSFVLLAVIGLAIGNTHEIQVVTLPTVAEGDVTVLPTVAEGDVDVSEDMEDISMLHKMEQQCLKHGPPGAYGDAWVTIREGRQCITSLVNPTVVLQDVKEAKSAQDLRVVIRKNCRKVPQLLGCVKNITAGVGPCLSDSSSITKLDDMIAAILNTVCFNEGERVALYITEGGPGCFDEQKENISVCWKERMNNTLTKNEVDFFGDLESEETQCRTGRDLLDTCVVQKLALCKQQAAVNLVDSVLKAMFKVVPCGNSTLKQEPQQV